MQLPGFIDAQQARFMRSEKSGPPADKALLTSGFRYAEYRLFLGRARLFADRIEFVGLHWRGVHRRTVTLHELAGLRWRTDSEGRANMTFILQHDEPIRLWLKGAGLWKYKLHACLGQQLNVVEDLPGVMTAASAA